MNAEFFALAFTAALNPRLLAIDLCAGVATGPVWKTRLAFAG